MKVEYYKWHSDNLNRTMELKVYGWYGKPVLIFPCQGGRFYEAEDFSMISSLRIFINEGKIKIFTIDSVDNESWCCLSKHPAERGKYHQQYEYYVIKEVVPFIRKHCNTDYIKLIATGASMGAYHAANFFFKHPYIFDTVISLSGVYDLRGFVGEYVDEYVYFNSPLFYLPNLEDEYYLNMYRKNKIIICVGQGAWEDEMLDDTRQLEWILNYKNIPAWIDYWGHDVNHDWPWWKIQLPYFLNCLGY